MVPLGCTFKSVFGLFPTAIGPHTVLPGGDLSLFYLSRLRIEVKIAFTSEWYVTHHVLPFHS